MDDFRNWLSLRYGNNNQAKANNDNKINHLEGVLMAKFDDLKNQLTISNRKVDMLEFTLLGKLSKEEYSRLQSMYASADTENYYLADQAVKSLKENL